MAQLAVLKNDKNIFSEIENELDSYKFYVDFFNITKEYDLNVCSKTSQKMGIIKLIDRFSERLPEHLQEFITLRYKNGCTIEETAEKMSITPRTCYRYRLKVLHKFKIFFGT